MKDQIVEVALTQFLKYGIRTITISKLVAPMGISTKTVYKYFRNKEELLQKCLELHYSRMAEEFKSLEKEEQNPVETLFTLWYTALELDFGINEVFYHDLNYYYPELQDQTIQSTFHHNLDFVKNHIEKGIEKGYFRKDIHAGMVYLVCTNLYTSLTRSDQYKKFKLNAGQLMQNSLVAYLRGLCTEKGIAETEKFNPKINKVL